MIQLEQHLYLNNKAIILKPSFFKNNSSQVDFELTGSCIDNTKLIIDTTLNQTLFFYKSDNQKIEYKSLKYNTLEVTTGDSQLRFFEINTEQTFGTLKPSVPKSEKDFIVQSNFEKTVPLKELYEQVDNDEYSFNVGSNSSNITLDAKILLEITGRYTVVLFCNKVNSIDKLDYVILTDITPNG